MGRKSPGPAWGGAKVGGSKTGTGRTEKAVDCHAWHPSRASCFMTSPPWKSVYSSGKWAGSPLLRGSEEVIGEKALGTL